MSISIQASDFTATEPSAFSDSSGMVSHHRPADNFGLGYNSYLPSINIGSTNLSYTANEKIFVDLMTRWTELVVTAEVAAARQMTSQSQIEKINTEVQNAVDRAPPFTAATKELFAAFDSAFSLFRGGYPFSMPLELDALLYNAISSYFSISNEISSLLTGGNNFGAIEYTNISLTNAVYRPTGVLYGYTTVAASYETELSSSDTYTASLGNDLIYFGSDPTGIIDTGRGNDIVVFSYGDNIVRDGAGNDLYLFSSLYDNEVRYSSSASSNKISILSDGSLSVQNTLSGETDHILGVDRLVFSDKTVVYDEASRTLLGNGNPVADGTVYRFFNKQAGGHFFTTNPAERDAVAINTGTFKFEGTGFKAELADTARNEEVYRFFNKQAGGHFFTTSEAERNHIQNTMPQFQYEGVGFYAFDTKVSGSTEVYRFFNKQAGGHFFTTDVVERDAVMLSMPQYQYEGVGFYAYML